MGRHADDAILQYALDYAKLGYAIIPIRADGSKAPACKSEGIAAARSAPGDPELVKQLFSGRYVGIGLLQGKYSGNREVIDIESPEIYEAFCEAAEKASPGTLEK